jgi:hypothetical protein
MSTGPGTSRTLDHAAATEIARVLARTLADNKRMTRDDWFEAILGALGFAQCKHDFATSLGAPGPAPLHYRCYGGCGMEGDLSLSDCHQRIAQSLNQRPPL